VKKKKTNDRSNDYLGEGGGERNTKGNSEKIKVRWVILCGGGDEGGFLSKDLRRTSEEEKKSYVEEEGKKRQKGKITNRKGLTNLNY